jgi:hypothetical protein
MRQQLAVNPSVAKANDFMPVMLKNESRVLKF